MTGVLAARAALLFGLHFAATLGCGLYVLTHASGGVMRWVGAPPRGGRVGFYAALVLLLVLAFPLGYLAAGPRQPLGVSIGAVAANSALWGVALAVVAG